MSALATGIKNAILLGLIIVIIHFLVLTFADDMKPSAPAAKPASEAGITAPKPQQQHLPTIPKHQDAMSPLDNLEADELYKFVFEDAPAALPLPALPEDKAPPVVGRYENVEQQYSSSANNSAVTSGPLFSSPNAGEPVGYDSLDAEYAGLVQ
eukprot:jgi/Chrzof1/11495/UNPLg00427.t1